MSIFITKNRLFFYIGILLYVFVNILNVRTNPAVQAVSLALGVYTLCGRRPVEPLPLFPFILVLDGVWLLAASIFILLRSITMNLKSWANRGLFILIPSAILLIQVFFVGGKMEYNIARYISILTPAALLFLFANKNIEFGRYQGADIVVIYLVTIVLSIVCKKIYFPQERLSIFNGTENIAFIMISILFIATQSKFNGLLVGIVLSVPYVVYLYTLNSRTAAILAIAIIGCAIVNKVNKAVLIFAPVAGIVLLLKYVNLEELGVAFGQLKFMLENVSGQNFLEALSMVDIRGSLYAEAIENIISSPIFGHGAIQPSFFDVNLYGIQEFHNAVLDIMVTFGLVGFVCYVVIYVSTIFSLRWKGVYLWAAVLIFIVTAMVQPVVFNIQAMLACILALALVSSPKFTQFEKSTA